MQQTIEEKLDSKLYIFQLKDHRVSLADHNKLQCGSSSNMLTLQIFTFSILLRFSIFRFLIIRKINTSYRTKLNISDKWSKMKEQ